MSSLNYMELCRLCLVKERVSIPIFEGEGDVRQIFLKIASCLPVKVTRDDKLPKKICDDCMFKLDNTYQFWNTTANAEKQLLQWLGEVSVEDKKSSVPSNTIETEQLVLKEEAIEQESPEVSKGLNRVEAVLDDDRGGSDDEDTESDEEGSNSEDMGDDEPPGKEEAESESEEESMEPLEPTTFVNVSLAGCDEAGPSGIQQPGQTSATQPAQLQAPPSTSSAAPAQAATASSASGLAGVPTAALNKQPLPVASGSNCQFVCILPPIVMKRPPPNSTVVLNCPPRPRFLLSDPTTTTSVNLSGRPRIATNTVLFNTPPMINSPLTVRDENVPATTMNVNLPNSPLLTNSRVLFNGQQLINNPSTVTNTRITGSHLLLNGSGGSVLVNNANGGPFQLNTMSPVINPLLMNTPVLLNNPTGASDNSFLLNNSSVVLSDPSQARIPCFIMPKQANTQVFPVHTRTADSALHVEIKKEPKDAPVEPGIESPKQRDIEPVPFHPYPMAHTEPPPENLSCDNCNKKFVSKDKLRKHMTSHENVRPYECKICCRRFKRMYEAKTHELNHNAEKKYKCEFCGYSALYKSVLEIHKRRHSGEYTFICDTCGKGFFCKSSLEKHIEHHTGVQYQCDTCGNVYSNRSNYCKHRKMKHPELVRGASCYCRPCKKYFPSMQAFQNHSKDHVKRRKRERRTYVCDICGKSVSSLMNHRRIHTGEKPYSCKVCGKAFNAQSYLKVHKLMHTGERPHRCDECGKRFTQRSSLIVHKRYHSGSRPFHCQICEKNFVTRTLLKIHFKTHGTE